MTEQKKMLKHLPMFETSTPVYYEGDVPEYAQAWECGKQVTVKRSEEAYYSNYGGQPEQHFTPQHTGTIASIMVPYVNGSYRRHTKHDCFVCVDFIGDDGQKWRAGVAYDNLVAV